MKVGELFTGHRYSQADINDYGGHSPSVKLCYGKIYFAQLKSLHFGDVKN